MFFQNADFCARILTVGRIKCDSGAYAVEPRSFSALAYRVSGSVDFSFGDKKLTAGKGSVLYVPKGLGYEAEYHGSEIIVFHFTEASAGTSAELFEPSSASAAEAEFARACKLWTEAKAGYRPAACSVFYEILHRLESERKLLEGDERIKRALEYIADNFADAELSVPKICRHAGISETGLRRLFREATGMSLVRYVTEARLAAAERMLTLDGTGVEETAVKCGFSDAKYFSRVMRKYRSIAPSELIPKQKEK